MSLGFAAFSNTLNITSMAKVTPDSSTFKVKLSTSTSTTVNNTYNVPAKTYTSGITTRTAKIDNSGAVPSIVDLHAEFKKPGDYVEYEFYAVNTGEYVAYLNTIMYSNISGSSSFISCSPGAGTNQTMVNNACNAIKVKVTVAGENGVETTTDLNNHLLAKKQAELIKVRIYYNSTGALADGPFSVVIGNINLVYSTATTYTGGGVISGGTICTLLSGTPKAIGSKYSCNVDGSNSYNFYILSKNGTESVNLVMDTPICSNGMIPVGTLISPDECTTYSSLDSDGPIDSMNHLYNATKNWTNIPNIIINHLNDGNGMWVPGCDEGGGPDHPWASCDSVFEGYEKIVTVGNITKIYGNEQVNPVVTASYTNLKARLPYYSETENWTGVSSNTCWDSVGMDLYMGVYTGFNLCGTKQSVGNGHVLPVITIPVNELG